MLQRFLLLIVVFLTIGTSVKALNNIDNFVRDHCGLACNGESDDCKSCYNEAVDLFDQTIPTSPEVNFDIDDDHGKLEWEF